MFKEHPGQVEVWNAEERIVAIVAGWRSGKTVCGGPWLRREMQRRGPGDYAVITPNFPLLDSAALPYLKQALKGLAVYKKADNLFQVTPEGARRLWGKAGNARVLLRHAEKAEAIEAFEAKALWVDEPGQIGNEVWESIQARVSVDQGRILLTSRPYEFNWYYHQIWMKRNDDPWIKVINFRSIDNPVFPKAEYERQKSILPEWKFKMKYDGIFTRPAGAVFDFNDAEFEALFVDPIDIPYEWQRATGHDFGEVNTAAVFAAKDPEEGTWYVYKSYHSGRCEFEDHVERFRNRIGVFDPERPVLSWGGTTSEDATRRAFYQAGWPIFKPPVRDLKEGIDRLYAMFRAGKIKIFKNLKALCDEVRDYSYEIDDYGEPTQKIKDKQKFHRLDSTRYLAASLYDGVDTFQTVNRFDENYEDDDGYQSDYFGNYAPGTPGYESERKRITDLGFD